MTSKKFLFLVSGLVYVLTSLIISSCDKQDEDGLFGSSQAKTDTIVRHDTISENAPVYFDIVGKDTILLDEDGVPTDKRQDRVVAILKAVPAQVTVDADEQWRLREESNAKTPSYEWVGGEASWTYNHGSVITIDSLYAVYKGRKLPLYPPKQKFLKVVQNTLTVSEYGAYGTKADVEYSLTYNGAVLATATQELCTEPGFVDKFLGIRILRQTHKYGSGVYNFDTQVLTCVDTIFYAPLWTSGLKDERFVLVHMENGINIATSNGIVADLTKTVGQVWTGATADLGGYIITETWQYCQIREDKVEVTVEGQTFNLKDSALHDCKWLPDGGKVESAKKIRFDFAREGVPTDNCKAYKDADIKQRTIVDLIYSFWHKAFAKRATVSGKTLTVKCDNGSKFQPKFDDNTLGEVVEGNFVETLTFNLSHPDYVASAAKGKTYSVGSDGRVTIEGQVWSITFASRVIESIPYNGKDYKNDPKVPKCEATPTTIYFCSDCDSVEYTFKHESEIIKGREKVTYNFVVDYEVVEEHHDTWGQISSSNGTWTLPCSNYVEVVPIYKDGTRGQAEKLDYTAYNTWKMTKMLEVEVTNPSDYVNVTVQIMDGKASVAGGEAIFAHTMAANKVTKGSWSYQPGNCPADATYFTPISATQARVDVYHDSKKIREFVVPISLVQKLLPITINGEIIRIDRTHAYQNQHGSYEGTYWHILARLADGSYIDYVIREESYNKNLTLQQNMKEYKLSASDGKLIVDSGEALALVWDGSQWLVGTVTSDDNKAAVGFYIEYHYRGQLAYTLGNGTGTHSQGNQGFPNAILGSWTAPSADGTWPITIAGQKFILQGS